MKDDFAKFYLKYIKTELSGLNLTRITDEDDFYEKQILDSIIPFEKKGELHQILAKVGMLVDVGFGGGFPILPLRNILPREISILGIDSRNKKVKAVEEISRSYSQGNIKFLHSRVEDFFFDDECLITLKAVGEVNKMLKLINAVEGVYVAFYKTPNVKKLEPGYRTNPGWEFVSEIDYKIGSNSRCILLFKKVKSMVPNKNKSLVNLSQFVFN